MTPRSAGAYVRFYRPPARPSLACRLGWHRPTVVAVEDRARLVKRVTCSCRRFHWFVTSGHRSRRYSG